MNNKVQDILEILEGDAKITPEEISELVRVPIDEVLSVIKNCEDQGIIRQYKAIIDWERADATLVHAIVQIKVSLERGSGYEKIAERISKYKNVWSLRLLSGEDFDLEFTVRGKSMRDIAFFVADKIATLEQVQTTSTHFILKTYKKDGVIFMDEIEEFKRQHVSL